MKREQTKHVRIHFCKYIGEVKAIIMTPSHTFSSLESFVLSHVIHQEILVQPPTPPYLQPDT